MTEWLRSEIDHLIGSAGELDSEIKESLIRTRNTTHEGAEILVSIYSDLEEKGESMGEVALED